MWSVHRYRQMASNDSRLNVFSIISSSSSTFHISNSIRYFKMLCTQMSDCESASMHIPVQVYAVLAHLLKSAFFWSSDHNLKVSLKPQWHTHSLVHLAAVRRNAFPLKETIEKRVLDVFGVALYIVGMYAAAAVCDARCLCVTYIRFFCLCRHF